MKKNFLTLAFLGICLLAGSNAMALSSPFPDVDGKHEHAGAITYLRGQGIISGYDDGTFRPDKTINRAEALKLVFLVRQALNEPVSANSKSISFPDVKSSDWFYTYVKDAYSLGIVQGYNDGYFRPANEITAAESLKIIYTGLIPELSLPTATSPPFAGVKESEWYAPYLEYGKSKQYIEADENGSYRPEQKMTRAKFAEAVYRVMYTKTNSLDKFPLNTDWRYCNVSTQGYKIKRPYSWQTFSAGEQLIFWKQDEGNGQVSFARLYPNSAVVIVAVDENTSRLPLQAYLEQIEYGVGANKQNLTLNNLPYASIVLENSGLQDSYFQLPDSRILAVYAQTGDGPLNAQLKEEIRYMVASVRASSSSNADEDNCFQSQSTGTTSGNVSSTDQLKAVILQMVLVNGKASSTLQQVTDAMLFETDSIGIGTGPVDYYYSTSLNLTLKVDRNSDTILATQTGNTSSF